MRPSSGADGVGMGNVLGRDVALSGWYCDAWLRGPEKLGCFVVNHCDARKNGRNVTLQKAF